MIKKIESLGVILALIGSFVSAYGNFAVGYPVWLVSSFCLCYTAIRQKNGNLLILQASFLIANILGIAKNNLHIF